MFNFKKLLEWGDNKNSYSFNVACFKCMQPELFGLSTISSFKFLLIFQEKKKRNF